ncbi:hypothetical protein BC938DRAFT_474617 [Jimgerdemannia flammicorona]|uniref:Uncharacterized protein n=1 Tax=Jimgerdemannia flammicorona TaxID=994334 RepID=A0A433QSE0_9FUNG|nr:hypothetical protein BC938DRAFT_474617 [Jimgerdemannia flammicorona]
MCPVHEDFRCIVIMDQSAVEHADPPLLNRFEKQRIGWDSLLNEENSAVVKELATWAIKISAHGKMFGVYDMFVGYCGDNTLRCLVMRHSNWGKVSDKAEMLEKCKQNLIEIACSEAIVRSTGSPLAVENPEEVARWYSFYFNSQKHSHLSSFFDWFYSDQVGSNDFGNVLIKTFSNINTDIHACVGREDVTVEKLELFHSESQLQSNIQHFWLESTKGLLILQCDPATSSQGCVKLARFFIDFYRKEYLAKALGTSHQGSQKCACIMMHINRGVGAGSPMLDKNRSDFLCDWYQIFIEELTPRKRSLTSLLDGSIYNIIHGHQGNVDSVDEVASPAVAKSLVYPFSDILEKELQWCLLCIKYDPSSESLERIRIIGEKLPYCQPLVHILQRQVETLLEKHGTPNWQYHTACDKQTLKLSNSFSRALEKQICHVVRVPLAKLIYSLEKKSALSSLFFIEDDDDDYENNALYELWMRIFNDHAIFKIETTEPQPNGYRLPGRLHIFRFPFSRHFMERIEGFKLTYFETPKTALDHHEQFVRWVTTFVPLLEHRAFEKYGEFYLADLLTMSLGINTSEHIRFLSRIVIQELEGRANPVLFHVHWWENEERIMTQLRIVQFCMSNMGCDLESLLHATDDRKIDLAPYVARLVLLELREAIDTDIWQRNADTLLALCAKIPEYNNCAAWRLLKCVFEICSTLVFPRKLPLRGVLELVDNIHNAELTNDYLQRFVADVLTYFGELDQTDLIRDSVEKHNCQRTFFIQCLEIVTCNPDVISRESLANLGVLEQIFIANPLPQSASLIQKIFVAQNSASPELFFNVLELPLSANATNGLSTEMQMIKRCLDNAGLDSQLAVICCDVICERFLAPTSISKLGQLFENAFTILQDFREPLKYICAVALMKTLFGKLALQFGRGVFHGNDDVVKEINLILEVDTPVAYRVVVYFLQSLRDQFGLSPMELRDRCAPFQDVLPWIANERVKWDQINYTRKEFDPYTFASQARQAYEAFSRLQATRNESGIVQLLSLQDFNSKLGLFGAAVNLLFTPSSVQWNQSQAALAAWLTSTPHLTGFPRQLLNGLVLDRNSPLLPETDDNPEIIMRHSVIAHVIVLHAALEPRCTPLATYLHNPEQVQPNFVVACPADETTAILHVLQSTGGFTRRYQCSCGMIYVVANCGLPMIQSRCPTCGRTIGGTNHQWVSDSRPVDDALNRNDLRGYVFESPESIEYPQYTHSMLTPTAYRVLHLFTHSIFAFVPSAIANAVTNQDPRQYCLDHICKDWNVLKHILNCDDDMLHVMLHAVLLRMEKQHAETIAPLSTVDLREAWMTSFMNTCLMPEISNLRQSIAEYRTKLVKVQQDGYLLEHELMETLDLAAHQQEQQQQYLTLWRYLGTTITDEMFVQELRTIYEPNPEKHRQFPFLGKFFNHWNNLNLVQYLLPLIRFPKEIRARLGHRIKREDARRLTFAKFLEQERKKSEYHLYVQLVMLFSDFVDAWNSVRHLVTRFGCEDLPPMEEMTVDTKVVFAIYEPKDESVYLHVALETLAQYQNNFLADVGMIEVNACRPLVFLQPTEVNFSGTDDNGQLQPAQQRATFTSVRLQDLHDSQVIADANDCLKSRYHRGLLMNFQRRPEYGRGQVIEYDLAEIEAYLARMLVFNKVHIQTEMDKFPYRGEMFQEHMNITSNIEYLIPQVPLDNRLATDITNDSNLRDMAPDLLSDLEILLCYLERTLGKLEVNENMLIKDYCHQWLSYSSVVAPRLATGSSADAETVSSLSVLNPELFRKTVLGELRLGHVVAFYETIENMVSNVLFDLVPEKYRIPLEAGDIITEEFIMTTTNITSYDKLCAALRKFVIRYLTSANSNLAPDDPIIGKWQDLISEDDDVIATLPESLLVGHVYEAYNLLCKRQDEMAQEQQPVTEVLTVEEQEELELAAALALSLQTEDEMQQNNYETDEEESVYMEDEGLQEGEHGEAQDDSDSDDDEFVDAEEFFDADEIFDEIVDTHFGQNADVAGPSSRRESYGVGYLGASGSAGIGKSGARYTFGKEA